ncbi:uncharacterized protein C18orf63 homolog [Dermochelys coriacea]|uniref:uncharacterized protein C18orf63 homolog n=1 Tax=Dermochelys coriacea TaxID=27794 RepID=UPI001CA82CC1|nr:uncharacterized protein C18orf63 homolog [Dermochelys coriacea]
MKWRLFPGLRVVCGFNSEKRLRRRGGEGAQSRALRPTRPRHTADINRGGGGSREAARAKRPEQYLRLRAPPPSALPSRLNPAHAAVSGRVPCLAVTPPLGAPGSKCEKSGGERRLPARRAPTRLATPASPERPRPAPAHAAASRASAELLEAARAVGGRRPRAERREATRGGNARALSTCQTASVSEPCGQSENSLCHLGGPVGAELSSLQVTHEQISFYKTGKCQAYIQKHGATIEAPERISPAILQLCLCYTLITRLAPSWNKAGHLLVQGSNFLSHMGRQNAVVMDLNVSETQLCISIEACTIRLPPPQLEDFDISANHLRNIDNNKRPTVRDKSILSKLVLCLAKQEEGGGYSKSKKSKTSKPAI